MTTIGKSTNNAEPNNKSIGTEPPHGATVGRAESGSSWSRQQKLAMITGFVILALLTLALLLGLNACSKQSAKPGVAGVTNPAQTGTTPAVLPAPPAASAATTQAPAAAPRKVHKKRPATVTYSDPNSGISFRYPRKYELATGEKAQPEFADMGPAPMNFAQPGGVTVATVAMPRGSYPGTDFTSAFFSVNVNRSLSEQECSQFAIVDTHNPDGEPVDAENVKVGSMDLEKTTDFAADALKQAEAQYYHRYENGVCYEFVLGLGTAGYGTSDSIEPVSRDEVFGRLEKILATVKAKSVEHEQNVAAQTTAGADSASKQ